WTGLVTCAFVLGAILEQVVHFHVMKLDGGFFLWVGSAPVLSNLAVSMSSKYDLMPLSTLVMGDPSNTAANSLAQRLGKKLQDDFSFKNLKNQDLRCLSENRLKGPQFCSAPRSSSAPPPPVAAL
uniref:Proteasome assembly chaperone 4 n=1 Tax=Fundulus heteroclitus TaxID=8078 RepID=A0A3Q2P2L3_FUNHE